MAPRIPPLRPDELDDDARAQLAAVTTTALPAANIFATLLRHPGLFRKWMPFGGKLLSGKLPARDRELLILRTAWHCRSDYEWGQHVLLARAVGLSEDEISATARPLDARPWLALDLALLHAADELHADSRLSDATWSSLAGTYDERQLIEVTFVVGHYHMVAYALNSIGVEREAGVVGLPAPD